MQLLRIVVAGALGSAALLLCGQAANEEFRTSRATAESYIRQGKLSEAAPYLKRARRADPDHYGNNWDLALAYLETGNLVSARQQIRSMLAGKNTGELHNLLADLEEREGHYLEASREYQIAAQLDPTEKHLGDWGNQLLRHRAYEAALKVYVDAAERYPKSSPLRVGLAVAFYSRGQYDSAVRSICEAIDLNPDDPRPMTFLGQMHDISRELEPEVAKRLGNFVSLHPQSAMAHHYYALSLWKLPESDLAEVEAHFKASSRLEPRFPGAHLELGKLYEQQGRDSEAARELETAVRLDPGLDTAHYRLARIYQRLNRKELARKEFDLYERLHNERRQEKEKKETALPALILR
jgi:Tfp pilus assembly protein PilF